MVNGRLAWVGFGISMVIALAGAGCGSGGSGGSGSTSGTSGSGGTVESAPTCAALCSHIATVCGMAPQGCDQICAAATQAERDCTGKASTCAEVSACGNTGTTSASSTSSTTGSGGAGVSCDPYTQYHDTAMFCAQGCQSAGADDQKSSWCVKACDTDSDCSCQGPDCGAVSKCVGSPGTTTVCVPGCASDSDCAAHGWGVCNNFTTFTCSGGPHFN